MPALFKKSCAVLLKLLILTLVWCACCFAAVLMYTAVWPEQTGEEIVIKNDAEIDSSNVDDGYFMAMHESCSSSLKLRVAKDDIIYTYDLNNDGEYEVFPLQMGNGKYTCSIFKHVEGNKYSKAAEVTLNVELVHEYVPYLVSSQYVYYTPEFKAVEEAALLCEGMETDLEIYDAVVNYMKENFTYDYARAASNPGFYLGDVEGCFETRIGLCQDLSAVTACMLRTQGVPCQLVIGYADEYYHAWNKVYVDGEYRLLDITAVITGVPAKEYTEVRHY